MTDPTTVTGTLTFQSEKNGREITRRFPAFKADSDWAYIDLVDHAIDLVSLPDIGDYGWLQIDEEIIETPDPEPDPRIDPKVVGPQVVGGLYFCGYWHREYTVTAIEYKDGWEGTSITVRWEDDGHTTTHCTAWDEKWDRVITGEKAETEV